MVDVASAAISIVECGTVSVAARVSPSIMVDGVMIFFRLSDISMYERYGVARMRDIVNRFGGLDNCEMIAMVAWWLSSLVSLALFSGLSSDTRLFSVPPSSVEVALLSHLLSCVSVRFRMMQFPLPMVRRTMRQVGLLSINTWELLRRFQFTGNTSDNIFGR